LEFIQETHSDDPHLRIGALSDFRREDSILLSASAEVLAELAIMFARLADGLPKYEFSDIGLLDSECRIDLTARVEQSNSGLRRIRPHVYEWRVTREKCAEFSAQAASLIVCRSSGHQYLDADSIDNADMQVVLSFNEYPREFWAKHD